jgi:hypothetical protein
MGSHSGSAGDDEVRVPIVEALDGFAVHPLEPAETAIEAFILIKTIEPDGETSWAYRTTNRLNREELLGAFVVQVAVLKKELRDEWDDD